MYFDSCKYDAKKSEKGEIIIYNILYRTLLYIQLKRKRILVFRVKLYILLFHITYILCKCPEKIFFSHKIFRHLGNDFS
jgi:hypothetical protein